MAVDYQHEEGNSTRLVEYFVGIGKGFSSVAIVPLSFALGLIGECFSAREDAERIDLEEEKERTVRAQR